MPAEGAGQAAVMLTPQRPTPKRGGSPVGADPGKENEAVGAAALRWEGERLPPPPPPLSAPGKENELAVAAALNGAWASQKVLHTPPPVRPGSASPVQAWEEEASQERLPPSPQAPRRRLDYDAYAIAQDPQPSVEPATPLGSLDAREDAADSAEAPRGRDQALWALPVRSRSLVAPKIGTEECGDRRKVSCATRRISQENAVRARSIHERQQFDTVGLLLGGGALGSTATVVLPSGGCCDSSAGRFLYRARDMDRQFELEAQLPGGRLVRVSRNPLRQTVTFEGRVAVGRWALSAVGSQSAPEAECLTERLCVRVPPSFDLVGPPAQVQRNFAEGHCLLVFDRSGPGRERPCATDHACDLEF